MKIRLYGAFLLETAVGHWEYAIG